MVCWDAGEGATRAATCAGVRKRPYEGEVGSLTAQNLHDDDQMKLISNSATERSRPHKTNSQKQIDTEKNEDDKDRRT